MSDSDSDCELKRVDSTKIKTYTFAPSDTDYKLKIKPLMEKKFALLYTLKKGQSLPYSPDLDGIDACAPTPLCNILF